MEESKTWEDIFNNINTFEEEKISNNLLESNNVISLSLDKKISTNTIIKNNTSKCKSCNSNMIVQETKLICSSCGLEIENTKVEKNHWRDMSKYNVNNNGFMQFRFRGKSSYGNQKSLLMTSAEYELYRRNNINKELFNKEFNSTQHIPKSVIKEASEMFTLIKKNGQVYRKDGKWGVLAACLYIACYNNGISKTPSEIAKFTGIAEKFHSAGYRKLCDLNERGVINIPIKFNPIDDYVDRYMEILNIPREHLNSTYRTFVLQIIKRADDKNLHVIYDCKNNTKAVGTLYLLIQRENHLKLTITKEIIDEECGISKTTFIKYYKMLCKYYKLFIKIFKRNKIKMDPAWKNYKN